MFIVLEKNALSRVFVKSWIKIIRDDEIGKVQLIDSL